MQAMDIERLIVMDKQLLMFFNGSDSSFADAVVLSLTNALTWVPLYVALIYLVVKNNGKFVQAFLVICAALLCILLASGLSGLVMKPWVGRLRPSLDPAMFGVVKLAKGYTASGFSFFSSHAANTFSLAVFLSLVVRSRFLTFAMLFWSLVNAWTRLYLGVHYPSDIFVGLCWGALVGFVVYVLFSFLYMKVTDKLHYISSQYTRSGYSFSDINVVLSVMSLTFLAVLLRAASVS
jgi:undecaprenyl-diphosphatase